MTLLALATIAGVYIGLSRRVVAVAPFTFFIALLCSYTAVKAGHGALSIVVWVAVDAAALQCGYMLGLTFSNIPIASFLSGDARKRV